MENRRTFIKQLSAISLVSCSPSLLSANALGNVKSVTTKINNKIWACLMHLSFNFAGGINNKRWGNGPRKEFEPEQSLWDDAIKTMADNGINMLIINLDDSILWHSHPEISLRNSWTPERMRNELTKIRKLGIEPIPMLNFSTTHDAWLGKYSNMVSTKPYYKVCSDLINEAIDIFDVPRFIHLGMDEETVEHQSGFDHVVVRQEEQWWGDLYYYISEAMIRGVRPMMWADYVWHHPEMFFKMMPKSVLQCNWYYGEKFDKSQTYVKAYIDLAKEGYDQLPTASNDGIIYGNANNKSIGNTVDFCSENIDSNHLLGFMQTFWMPTIEKFRPYIIQAIELTGAAKQKYGLKHK